MKITRILCGALAALAVVAAMSSMVVMDHAYAAVGFTGASLAMAGMVTLKAPITLHYNGQYVAPGTEVELTKEEADRLTAAHGAFGGPGEPDPANTQMRNVDIASIKALNEQAKIHKGHGPEPEKSSDLAKLSKADLVALAEKEEVAIETSDTRPQIAEKIEAARKAKA